MRTRLHLIAAPWAVISAPSAQLGVLKAYVEQEMGEQVETRCYSAFLEILYRYRESASFFFYQDFKVVGEQIFMLIYHARYARERLPLSSSEVLKCLSDMNGRYEWESGTLSPSVLGELENHTATYIDEKIIPELIDDGVNVIGFTLNFSQVYSSVLMARMIQERARGKKLLFLWGGFSISIPQIFSLLGDLEAPGYAVCGEGEKKLVSILEDLGAQSGFSGALREPIPGVYPIGGGTDLYQKDEGVFRSQLSGLESLPVPNYDEYFEVYGKIRQSDPLFERLVPAWVTVEGSRGCFAKCDFCSHNSQWLGFRKLTHDQIYEKVLALKNRYGIDRIYFVDNVCDTFAEKFADRILQSGDKIRFYMNMRAHHPESYWIKLVAAGLYQCLIGVEAFSPDLLHKMKKGTLIVQNLKALKYLSEMGVQSGAGIITHHPKATEESARETLRVLEEISHYDPVETNQFCFGFGSPLYDELTDDQRSRLKKRRSPEIPAKMERWSAEGAFELPEEWGALRGKYKSLESSAGSLRIAEENREQRAGSFYGDALERRKS